MQSLGELVPNIAYLIQQTITPMRRTEQANKLYGRFSKSAQVLPVTSEVMAHYNCSIELIEVDSLADFLNRDTADVAGMLLSHASHVGRPVIRNRHMPTQ